MRFIYRGQFSKGLNSQISMGVTFRGREPSEVTDIAAVSWLQGHPDYELVPEAPAPERPIKRYIVAKPVEKPKKPAKAKAKK